MTTSHTFTMRSVKATIGSLMITAISLFAFVQAGQSCTLLPGWNPSTLADGQSRTGYKISEATYTQSCASTVGRITCTNGSLGYNGNVYKYQTCTPHTWANCTTPTVAAHLDYKTLYKLNIPTLTQTCTQLSQRLQCINGVFTGGITPSLYTYATCTDSNRGQCIDIRTNTYKDHLQTIFGYTTSQVNTNQSCNDVKKTLQCMNGTWVGGNQNSLFSGCLNNGHTNTSSNGQSCTLLPGFSPSTLADGQSRTGYQISEATYTQSCAAAAGTITCVDGSIANGNTFKYPSCIPHTWANCTTPVAATHLQYKVLYKLPQATYTQTCQQLSQNLRCLNGVFTGGTNPSLYTRATCIDPNRAQCVDSWTNSYRDHGESLIGYTNNHPALGQTCTTLQKTLTCTNGLWSGGTQASLYTGCTDPASFTGCVDIRTSPAITVPHGSSRNAYTSTTAQSCTAVLRPLTCTNGRWIGNGTAQQNGLYSGCVQANTASCPNVIAGTGQLLNGSFITKYTHPFAFEALGQACGDFDVSLQCVNGSRSGGTAAYTGCQTVSSGSCLNTWTNRYIPHLQFIYGYTQNQPTASLGCTSVKQQLFCRNSTRYSSGGASINQNSLFANCSSCILPRGGTLAEGSQITAYSVTGALFPKTCTQNYATTLSCSGGTLQGNWQTYKYPSTQCQNLGGLVSGTDLAINESNIRSGTYLAQGSSPQITILFQNKGAVGINKSNIGSGLLSCTRNGMNVYASKPITSFIVNPGTKVGINIRISPLFTQALGKKSIVCTVFPIVGGFGDVNTTNNTWSGSFEVVEAKRFDLALSTSIDPISKNLDAAEGALGTQGLQNFLYTKIMNVLFPLIIVFGILSAIIGFYKIMFSSDDKAIGEGTNFIIYGVIGIIVIMSAKFIGQNIFDLFSQKEITGYALATGLYNNIIYPFIKFAIYLVLGAMFVILVSRVITFLFGSDADAQKKAGTLIGWNIISMIIIIGAKQIVEAIYGKQDAVINQNTTNLGEIGTGILADKNIPILYQVINYALGMASLVILVIIIIQTVKLLMKPDDPAQVKSIKNSLAYMFIGILVLGAGYLIVNFAIIN